MTRRAFVRSLAALAACRGLFALASAADAQQPASPRLIGVLLVAFSLESREAQEFRHGLRDAGYAEGRDVVIEWRSANGDYARISELAADLVQRKVDVIVVDSTPGAQAVQRATSTIPIVVAVIGDPVGAGIVANLAHPGGNVTGFSVLAAALSAKRLQLLKETVPRLTRVAALWNPDTRWHAKAVEELKAVAPSLSIELSFVSVRAPEDFGLAFSAVSRAHAQALYVLDDAQFVVHRRTLLKLASKARLPDIYGERHFPDEGGLMSYGANYADHWRRSARYVDKILKGAKPGDLPIEQSTKFEFVVNLRTAKALGLTIPESVLLQANEVVR
jgi:putative ABC transport system substrate-binding protein